MRCLVRWIVPSHSEDKEEAIADFVVPPPRPKGGQREPLVVFDWVQGRDRELYESFCSHVARKVRERIAKEV